MNDDVGTRKRRRVNEDEGRRLQNKNNELLDTCLNPQHSHSRLGIVSGRIGCSEEVESMFASIVVVSNRFPAWLWTLGGCVEWCRGVMLVGAGWDWVELIRKHFGGLEILGLEFLPLFT